MVATMESQSVWDDGVGGAHDQAGTAREKTTSPPTDSDGETSPTGSPQCAAPAPEPVPHGTPTGLSRNIVTFIMSLARTYEQHLIPVTKSVAERLRCVANGAIDACTHSFIPPRGSFTEPGGVHDVLTASFCCVCIYAAARVVGTYLGFPKLRRPRWVPAFFPSTTTTAWLIATWVWILKAMHLSLRISHGEEAGGFLEDYVSGSVVVASIAYIFARGRGIFKRVDTTIVAWLYLFFHSLIPLDVIFWNDLKLGRLPPWMGYLP